MLSLFCDLELLRCVVLCCAVLCGVVLCGVVSVFRFAASPPPPPLPPLLLFYLTVLTSPHEPMAPVQLQPARSQKDKRLKSLLCKFPFPSAVSPCRTRSIQPPSPHSIQVLYCSYSTYSTVHVQYSTSNHANIWNPAFASALESQLAHSLSLSSCASAANPDADANVNADADQNRNTNTLFDDIQNHILTFPTTTHTTTHLPPSSSPSCEEIDARGTALWNLCTRLRRRYELESSNNVNANKNDNDDGNKNKKRDETPPLILLLTRVFAFLLLDLALEKGRGDRMGGLVRVMRVGIKAARNCVGEFVILPILWTVLTEGE